MKKAAMVARYLLGLGFLVFGANAFLNFMPAPEMSEDGAAFMGLLFASGYFYYIAILKIVGSLMLLLGRFVPLGLTLLGPILVNILLFHVSFEPASIGMGAFFSLLWFVVFWDRKDDFSFLWSARSS